MNAYEHVLIARPDLSSPQVETMLEELAKTIGELGGAIVRQEYWGLRNLTYRIRKNRKGHYGLLAFNAPPSAIHEMERRQRLNEDILRIMTVKLEEVTDQPSPILAKRDRDERRRRDRDRNDFGGADMGA